MKRRLYYLLTKGHPIEVKKKILKEYREYGEKHTCISNQITRSSLRRLLEFEIDLMSYSEEDIQKLTNKKRTRSQSYKEAWKLRNNPANKRKKHPLVVISRYANSNYKLVCFRNKIEFNENSILKPLDLWSIAKKQKNKCALSGLPLKAENVSVDHIIPISVGGANSKENIRLVISTINKMRNNMSDDEFFFFCREISKNNTIV